MPKFAAPLRHLTLLNALLLALLGMPHGLQAQTFSQIPALSFTKPFAGANPLPQLITVVSTGTSFTFNATATTTTGGAWLTISKSGTSCCATPEAITVTVNPDISLAVGSYQGQISLTTTTHGNLTIPVTLIVAATNAAYFDNTAGQLTFSMLTGAGSMPAQSIQILNGGTGTLSWTASTSTADGGGWLNVSALSGSSPSSVTVSISLQNLPGGGQTAGTFIGQLAFQAAGSSITIPVSVTVGTTVFRQVNPINFTMPFAGANPLPQILSVISTSESSNVNVNFNSVAVTGKGGAWLTVSKSGTLCCTTPEAITVSVNATTLAAGTYTGEITFTQYSTNDMAMTVPVTLTIASPSTTYFDSEPGQMTFSMLTGALNVTPQTLQVRNGGAGSLSWTGSVTTADGGDWLTATPLNGTAPTTATVSVNPLNLPGGGSVAGTFVGQLSFQTAGSSFTVPVSVSVGTSVFRQINPISFTMPFGGANPLPQILSVVSTGNSLNFDSVAVNSKGGAWLTVSKSGVLCCTTPEAITVSVNATTLAAGTYTGQVTFTQYSTHDTAITVPVTLTISPPTGKYFDSTPGQMSFSLLTGAASVPAQTLQVRNGGTGSFSWTGSVSTSDGGDWLAATPLSGSTPATVTVSITPDNLPGGGLLAGTFVGQLSFQTTGSSFTVPVSVTVGTSVFRQVNPISFTMPFGGANPLPQVLSVISTGTNINFDSVAVTSKGGTWLTVSKSGVLCCTTPEAITVSVSATTLAAGTYTGEITFTQYSTHDIAMTVPVTLTVSPTTGRYFDNTPGQMSFSLQTGAASVPAQTLQIRNGGTGSFSWTGSAVTSDGGDWLAATPLSGSTPSTVTVSITPANLPGGGLLAGTYVGQLSFQTTGSSFTVPVSVSVGTTVFRQVNPISFVMPAGGANPLPQVLSVISTGESSNANINFDSVAVSSKGGAWLTVSKSGILCCTTPEAITVSVNATALAAGTYTGEITFTQYSTHDLAMTVPVTLTVTSSSAYFDNIPGQASFSFTPSQSNPPSQTVQLLNGGSGTLNWTATSSTSDGGAWLTATPNRGVSPSTTTIKVNTLNLPGQGLIAGTYVGQVLLQGAGNSVSIPVSVNIGDPVFVQLPALTFSMVAGISPNPQVITVSSTSSAINFDAAAVSAKGGSWLTISPSGILCCATPKTITVSVNGTNLTPGTYIGQVNFTQYSTHDKETTVPVIVTVTGADAPEPGAAGTQVPDSGGEGSTQ